MAEKKLEKPVVTPPNFRELLDEMDDGNLHQNLTDEIPRIAKAVKETRKKGKLTLTLTFGMEQKQLRIKPEVKVDVPRPVADSTLFFVTEDGAVTKNDPRQLPLKNLFDNSPIPLRSVAGTKSTKDDNKGDD